MVDDCAAVSIQMILLEVENRGRGKRIPRQVGGLHLKRADLNHGPRAFRRRTIEDNLAERQPIIAAGNRLCFCQQKRLRHELDD